MRRRVHACCPGVGTSSYRGVSRRRPAGRVAVRSFAVFAWKRCAVLRGIRRSSSGSFNTEKSGLKGLISGDCNGRTVNDACMDASASNDRTLTGRPASHRTARDPIWRSGGAVIHLGAIALERHSLVQVEQVFQTPHDKKCNRKRGHKIEHEHTAASSARRPVPLCHFIPSHPRKFLLAPYPDVGNFTRPLQAPGLADEAISEVHQAVAESGQRSGDSVLNHLRHLEMRSVGTRGHNVSR